MIYPSAQETAQTWTVTETWMVRYSAEQRKQKIFTMRYVILAKSAVNIRRRNEFSLAVWTQI